MKAPTGNASLVALGLERSHGVPGRTAVTGYKVALPFEGDLETKPNPAAAVNPLGVLEPGTPGEKSGKVSLSIALTASTTLEFLEHLLGGVTKTVLEAGPPAVYRYLFEPDYVDGVETSFYGLLGLAPVERTWFYAILFDMLELDLGKGELLSKLSGGLGHATRMSAPVPDAANTGSYTMGPYLRGPLANAAAGKVHVQVTSVAPLQFKVHQTAAAPTFPGAAVAALLDPEAGTGTWQNLQDQAGLDLGFWGENKDPLEIIWPGDAADHGTIDVGDTWGFDPPGWATPAITYLAAQAHRLTSAHWVTRMRKPGDAAWIEKPFEGGKLRLDKKVTWWRGGASRYPYAVTRDGDLVPELELDRPFFDRFFRDRLDAEGRVDVEVLLQGRQLGTGVHREGLTVRFRSARVDEAKRPVSARGTVKEKVKLVGETNDAGDQPVTIEVVTSRNWTPSA